MNLLKFYSPRYTTNRDLVNELFENFFKNDYHEDYVKNYDRQPATNVFETEKDFKIEILLPGFGKDEVKVNLKNNLLTIKVDKEKSEEKSADYKYAHREFGAFNFEKQFSVPKTVNQEKISAAFENGVLNITLPKKEKALEKKPIEIKIS